MKKTFLAIYFLLILCPCFAEIFLSGESEVATTGYFFEDFSTSQLDYAISSSMQLSSGGDLFGLDAEVAILYADDLIEWSLENLLLTIYPLDFLDIRIGRFAYQPGASEFFSSVNFFSRTDLVQLLDTGSSDFLLPADLVQTGFYFNNSYLLLSLSPIKQTLLIPNPSSGWFPAALFPQQITVPYPYSHELLLNEIIIIQEDVGVDLLSDLGVCAEWGVYMDGFDLSLLYYYGWDYSLQMAAKVDLLELYEDFNIEISPFYSRVHAFGANFQYSFNSLRLYGDAAFYLNKRLLSEEVSVQTLETQSINAPYLNYSFGTTYEWGKAGFIWLLEYKGDWVFPSEENEAEVADPFLHSIVSGLMQYSLPEMALSAALLGFLSLEDMSCAAALRLNYFPVDEIELSLYFPCFFGESGTELGQFSEKRLFSLSLRCFY